MSWGRELGTGSFAGGEGSQAREEERGDRDRRAAEAAGAELPSAAKPRCLRGQPWGPGLLSPQCWQTKSRKDRQLPAPGMNLPSSQLPAFPLFPWRALGVVVVEGGVLACFAACVAPTQGWRVRLGRRRAPRVPPSPNVMSQRFSSRWGRRLTFSLCRAPSVAQTHTRCSRRCAPGGCWHPGMA